MDTFKSFSTKLYEVNESSFDDIALELFQIQAAHNPIYQAYIDHLGVTPSTIDTLESIPFLPISFFKFHQLKTYTWEATTVFTSSGTTGAAISKHEVYSLAYYLQNTRRCFSHFYGDLEQYHFLALLPSYLERSGSSLIAMMEYFIRKSKSGYSGFYLNDFTRLLNDIESLSNSGRKIILWGVSFALLDLAEQFQIDLSHCEIFETGGMKGRRKEITRQALHQCLKERLNVSKIYSEYGMTELMSQAYTLGYNDFHCPPWVKVIGRELNDPFNKGLLNETAGINVIDLANWHSVAFIETEDLGKIYENGCFEVQGRMDNSDIRGCNLLIE